VKEYCGRGSTTLEWNWERGVKEIRDMERNRSIQYIGKRECKG
jgi:hypothetical protein